SISDAVVMEGLSGTHNAEVTVRLSAPSTKSVTVDYITPSMFGTASAGSDYEAVSGKLTFAPGETTKSILVPVHGDRLPENDETFQVWLEHPKGATVANASGTVTILDSSPRISISDYATASQADSFMTFTVSLSAAYDQPVTVNYGTQ